MNSCFQMINNLAKKLGVQEQVIIQKAAHFLQLLEHKPACKTINDSAKIVICLDLAAGLSGGSIDKDSAVTLSGLRKTVYQNTLNNVSKTLGLDKSPTIQEICTQMDCVEARTLINEILAKYKQTYGQIEDTKHPQYTAAAVFTACKVQNIKIKKENKSKLITMSRLKRAQWEELTEEFARFYKAMGGINTNPIYEDTMDVDAANDDQSGDHTLKSKNMDNETEIEEYEEWKTRIIDQAMQRITASALS